jgi:hypothetical protein
MAIRIALDLEFYATEEKADDTKLIQLGYSIFDTSTSSILYTGGDYLQIDIPLSDYIIALTGINQRDLDTKGVSVVQAVENMNSMCTLYKVNFSQLITWGCGDAEALLKSFLELKGLPQQERNKLQEVGWNFGTSYMNLKSVYQAFRISQNKSKKGGLKKTCSNLGLPWEVFVDVISIDENGNKKIKQRTCHDARCDALNTAKIYMELFK